MKNLCLVFSIVISFWAQSQELDAKWTSRIVSNNKKIGFFDHFTATNEKYIYSVYLDYMKDDIHLVAYDKEKMTGSLSIQLFGKKDKKRRKKLRNFNYFRTICISNKVIVFWKKDVKKKVEFYAETFDIELNRLTPIRRVAIMNDVTEQVFFQSNRRQSAVYNGNPSTVSRFDQDYLFQISEKSGGRIMIGTQVKQGNNKPIEFNYLILNSELEEVVNGKIELAVIKKLFSDYFDITSIQNCMYGNDGRFYLKHFVRNKSKSKGKEEFSVLSVVDPEDNSKHTIELKLEEKEVLDFEWVTDENGIRIYGYFSDLKLDPRGELLHGLFSVIPEGDSIGVPKFVYFSKEILEDFKETEDNSSFNLINFDRYVGNSFIIEQIEAKEDGSVIIYSTTSSNYYSINYSAGYAGSMAVPGQTNTTFKCKKKNVIAFKLSSNSELEWYSKVDRQKTFKNSLQNIWDIKDLKIIQKDDFSYVFYSSDLKKEDDRMVKKNVKEKRDKVEYAAFDLNTGNVEVQSLSINPANPKRKEVKRVESFKTEVFDNEIFINSTRRAPRPAYIIATVGILGTMAVCLTPAIPVLVGVGVYAVGVPTILTWSFSGNYVNMVGHIGKITIREK